MRRKSWKKEFGKVSTIRKPENLTLEDWQIALRRQIAQNRLLRFKNVGPHPLFSTFEVRSTKTGRTCRVVLRGQSLGIDCCSCPDFEVNTLGTCKHIESVLYRLGRKKENRELLRKGYVSEHSSVTLRYGVERRVFFSCGRGAGPALKKLVSSYFDGEGYLTKRGFR